MPSFALESIENHPHHVRDPKQFKQGYDANLKGLTILMNPYLEGGEWNESWWSGWQAFHSWEAHLDVEKRNAETESRLAKQRKLDKQARNKLNRKTRGDADRQLQLRAGKGK